MAKTRNSGAVSPWKTWTIAHLRRELRLHNVRAPTWMKRSSLVSLYEKKIARHGHNTANLGHGGSTVDDPRTPVNASISPRGRKVSRRTNGREENIPSLMSVDDIVRNLDEEVSHMSTRSVMHMNPDDESANNHSNITQKSKNLVASDGNNSSLSESEDLASLRAEVHTLKNIVKQLQTPENGHLSHAFVDNLGGVQSNMADVNKQRDVSTNQHLALGHLTSGGIPSSDTRMRQLQSTSDMPRMVYTPPTGFPSSNSTTRLYQQDGMNMNNLSSSAEGFSLATAYHAIGNGAPGANMNSNILPLPTSALGSVPSVPGSACLPNNGVPSDSLPFVEIISPQLRKDILQGKNINMSSLLIPGAKSGETDLLNRSMLVGDELIPLKPITDPRLSRSLTIQEFIQAFSTYKNIMCDVYPSRRVELDAYLRDIIDMSVKFGGFSFYEYHKAFSARAAALLQNYNTKVDWSRRDNNLFCSIFAGHKANACAICNSLTHTTDYCSLSQIKSSRYGRNDSNMSKNGGSKPGTDRKGRARIQHQGKEVCNDFNSETGCLRQACAFQHICIKCFKSGHKAINGKCQQGGASGSKVGGPPQIQNNTQQ